MTRLMFVSMVGLAIVVTGCSTATSELPERLAALPLFPDSAALTRGGAAVREDVARLYRLDDHCHEAHPSIVMLEMAWPPGKPDEQGLSDRFFVRDPEGLLGEAMANGFRTPATLDDEAIDTGFRAEGIEIWLKGPVAEPGVNVLVVFADRIEEWPSFNDSLCA